MATIITTINQKGGVGKTTTAHAIGTFYKLIENKRVLFIDTDPQANLSYSLGADITGLTHKGTFNLLTGAQYQECIQQTPIGDVIASTPALASAEQVLTEIGKEYRLKEALEPFISEYDYIIIDTPPTFGVLTINALVASQQVVIPAQADIFSLQGIGQLSQTLETVKKYCNPNLYVRGILLTRYNNRTNVSKEIKDMMNDTAEKLGTCVFNSRIRECTAIKEAQASKQSIFTYAPKSNATQDYIEFIKEMEN